MKKELQQILFDNFPHFFSERRPINLESNVPFWPICFGIECNSGWFEILRKLCVDIHSLSPPEDFKFHQIKEKFGGLRIYVHGSTEKINALINIAEDESYKTCEVCGTKKWFVKTRKPFGWLYVNCWFCHIKYVAYKKYKDFKFTLWWRYKKLIAKIKKLGKRK